MAHGTLKWDDSLRHATWLELFFDLVFVASAGVITHHLAEVHDGHVSRHHLWLFISQFAAVWWIWATHTLFANRFDRDSGGQRAMSLFIMLLMVAMSAFLHDGLESSEAGVTAFVLLYVSIRLVLAGLFAHASLDTEDAPLFASKMGWTVVAGAVVAALSLAFEGPARPIVFFGALVAEMGVFSYLGRSADAGFSVHREHLVERIGLLSIIMLGESVISLVAGLSGIQWNSHNLLASVTGFAMLASIWWIYFDSFHVLERARRLQRGFVLLYSNALFLLGLGVLASVIRHAIVNDLAADDFRWMLIGGMTLFYLGKQISYFVAFPPYRKNLVANSIVCISVTVVSTFLPRIEYALVGATLGMVFYSISNFRWTLTKDVTDYLVEEAEAA